MEKVILIGLYNRERLLRRIRKRLNLVLQLMLCQYHVVLLHTHIMIVCPTTRRTMLGIEWGEFEKMKVSVAPLNGRQSVENNRKDAKVRGAWLAQSHESKKRDAIEK